MLINFILFLFLVWELICYCIEALPISALQLNFHQCEFLLLLGDIVGMRLKRIVLELFGQIGSSKFRALLICCSCFVFLNFFGFLRFYYYFRNGWRNWFNCQYSVERICHWPIYKSIGLLLEIGTLGYGLPITNSYLLWLCSCVTYWFRWIFNGLSANYIFMSSMVQFNI